MKRMFKKAISILLVAVMVFGAAPLAGFVGLELPELNIFTTKAKAEETPTSGTCGDNVMWEFDEESGELVISGEGEMDSFLLEIPPWNNFKDNIKAVTIGNGVTNIGDYAFVYCTSLMNLTIPDSVTSIGDDAFFGCVSLISITIPDSVTEIGLYAFKYCSTLKNITIPAGVTSIGFLAFSYCNSLESIFVDSGNSVYSSDKNGVLFNKDKTALLYYPAGNPAKSCTIPDGVTNIESRAFYACTSLESITIPDSVTNLGEYAFALCTKLKGVKIGRGITTLKSDSFEGCFSLEYIIIPETVKSISAYAFSLNKAKLKDVYYGGSKSEWEQIVIGANNEPLYSAKIHYNSTGPVDSGSTETPDNTPDYDSSVTDTYLVPTPTETIINYGDSIVLHIDPSKIPEGGKAEWYAGNGNFSYSVSSDGTTCTITPDKKGDTTFTALIYDAEGNIVSADEQTMTSKAGFFDKIIAFFKKLFGLAKTIPEAIKVIY